MPIISPKLANLHEICTSDISRFPGIFPLNFNLYRSQMRWEKQHSSSIQSAGSFIIVNNRFKQLDPERTRDYKNFITHQNQILHQQERDKRVTAVTDPDLHGWAG